MDLNEYTLDFILSTKWENLPLKVQNQVKLALLDNLGAQIAGCQTPVSEIVTKFACEQYGSLSEATVLVTGQKISAIGAALANGVMANALDIDDGQKDWVFGHPGACTISPLLAAVQKFKPNCTGKEFLTALLVGYETGIRAAKIRHDTYATYHSSGSWGAICGVAAIGNLLQLERTILREALGIAEYHAPIGPMRKGIVKPAMVKDSIGWGCSVAFSSILLAQSGFTGVAPIFADTKDRSIIESLGSDYKVMTLYFKQFPSCRWGHPSIQAAINVKVTKTITVLPLINNAPNAKFNPNPTEIDRVIVRSHRDAQTLPLWAPNNTEEAQYTLAHPVAAALIDGELGPQQQTPPRLHDKDIRELSAKVRFELDEEFDRAYAAREFASVTVELKNGAKFESGPTSPNWTAYTPPSEKDIEDKFMWLVTPVLGVESAVALKQNVKNFEEKYVTDLIHLCLKQ